MPANKRLSTVAKEIATRNPDKAYASVYQRLVNASKAKSPPFKVSDIDGIRFVDGAEVANWYESVPTERRGRSPEAIHQRIANYLGMNAKEVTERWEQAGKQPWSSQRKQAKRSRTRST